MFGDIEQERIVEQVLFQLKQQSLVVQYQVEFQQYAACIDQDKVVLKAQFYCGLKDAVKDKLSRMEQLETMAKLIETTIKIDNCIYKRTLEWKGQYKFGTYTTKGKNRNEGKGSQATLYWLQPMELDAFQRKGQVSKEEMDCQRKEKLYFQCSKPGYMASFYTKNPKGKRPIQRIHIVEKKV